MCYDTDKMEQETTTASETTTTPFEVTHPEEAQMLMDICSERANQRNAGKKLRPIFLTNPEPITAPDKTRRNDPCPCGSGKKYKKCCINE